MRAEQTKKALGTSAAKAQGFGEEKLIYDNELPEGRFYCRTIEITVRTKKE
jgi:flagellar motor protein MotB